MRKSIIIYSILLVCLIGISLFLTSNFLDSSKANPNEVIVKNIFQADEVSLRISFDDTEIDFVIKSEMLNSLADSDFMRLFMPKSSYLFTSTLRFSKDCLKFLVSKNFS